MSEPSVFFTEGAKAGDAFKEYVAAFVERAAPFVNGEIVAKAAARSFGVYYQHILDLAVDKYGIPQEPSEEKSLCAACWCNTCAKLDECDCFPQADGITPPPCANCQKEALSRAYGATDTPLMPHGEPPECGDYVPENGG